MTKPVRLQLSRRKGFDLQAWSRKINGLPATKVTRPGPFGNPFPVATMAEVFDCRKHSAHHYAVTHFRRWLAAPDESFEPLHEYDGQKDERDSLLRHLPELRGRNLACFCAPEFDCHADVLLELANTAEATKP